MPEPWGFGKSSGGSRQQVRDRIEKLKLPIYKPDNSVRRFENVCRNEIEKR
jgi:hypothetical protein